MGYLTPHPRVSRRRLWRAIAIPIIFAIASAAGLNSWRAYAQRPANPPVQLNDSAAPQRVERLDDDRGGTYRWLEGQASRTSTRFADAVAVTERSAAGELQTRLTDLSGTELARFNVRSGGTVHTLEYRQDGAEPLRASGKPGLNPTLEWGNHQAYLLWKEQLAVRRGQLEWQGSLIRPRGADKRSGEVDPEEVVTEWPNGLVAQSRRFMGQRRHVVSGAPVRSRVLTSKLNKDGVEVGFTQWYEQEQVVTWVFPGLSEGFTDPKALEPLGGLPFTPDAGWTNVQSMAFYTFHTAMKERGAVAPQAAAPGMLQKVASLFMPTLLANEPGCDNLHWLDGTIYRPCCDIHDACYEKFSCTYKSWWQIWTSWQCDACNFGTLFCFATGGKMPYRQSYW